MVVAARKAVVVVVPMLTVPKSCLVSLEKRNSNLTLTEVLKKPLFTPMQCLLP